MKKKVALLLALVMVLSMMPMNVFGATATGPAANATVTATLPGTALAAHIDGLQSGGSLLQVVLSGATFTTPASASFSLLSAAGVQVTPAVVASYSLADPAVLNISLEGATIPAGNLTLILPGIFITGTSITVNVVDAADTDDIQGPILDAEPITIDTGAGAGVGDGNEGLTILPGFVLNPQPEPSGDSWNYLVTINMEQLSTTGILQDFSTRLEFELTPAVGDLRFTTPGNTDPGTPHIVIHETSQIFRNNVRVDPLNLPGGLRFAMTDGTPNRLDVIRLGREGGPAADRRVEAWLNLFDATGNRQAITGFSGTLVLEIRGIVADIANARLEVNRIGRFGQDDDARVHLVRPANGLLVFDAVGHGVNITSPAIRNFVTALPVPPIRIQERRQGSLEESSTHHVRLMGPRDYVWNVSAGVDLLPSFRIRQLGDDARVWYSAGLAGGADLLTSGVVASGIEGATGRPFIVLSFQLPQRRGMPHQELRGTIEIDGLALVPTRDTVPMGEVSIDVEVGRFTATSTQRDGTVSFPVNNNRGWRGATVTWSGRWIPVPLSGVGTGVNLEDIPTPEEMVTIMQHSRNWTTPPVDTIEGVRQSVWNALRWMPDAGALATEGNYWLINNTPDSVWRQTLVVGYRTDATVTLSATDLPNLRSGQRNFPLAPWDMQGPHPSSNYDRNNAFRGSRTARVIIEEHVPGAFNTAWNHSILNFNLETTDGVQFTHAAWRIWGPEVYVAGNPLRTTRGTQGFGGQYQGYGWQFVSLFDDDIHPDPLAMGVPTLTRDSLRLFVPRFEHPTALRQLEVYFFVSTVAGYEALYGDPINVSVSGDAVMNLSVENRDVDIATVYDPIVVTLDGPLVPMEVGQVMTPIDLTEIPDIIIEEVNAGFLRRGTVFNIGIEALPIPILGHHALVETVAVTDSASGLEVRATRSGTGQTAYMRIEVIRESQGEPGTITLTNNRVTGTFLPGIRYGVSVNAVPVATNAGPANIRNNPIAQNTARGLSASGLFDYVPYFVDIIEFGEFDYDGLPPGVGAGPGGFVGTIRFWEGMAPVTTNIDGYISVVQEPFRFWISYAGPRVAMANPRVFAYLIGASLQYEAGVATFTGNDAMGNVVTVTLTVGSTNAVVNGATVDIADFAGQSGPAGSISTQLIADRMFVPVRFLANAFGLITDASGFPVIELR